MQACPAVWIAPLAASPGPVKKRTREACNDRAWSALELQVHGKAFREGGHRENLQPLDRHNLRSLPLHTDYSNGLDGDGAKRDD
jgi:hypothetical protein